MTVSYQYEVASSTSGGFTRLLFMWRGSLYKLIYRELFLFLSLFALLSAIYRHVLSAEQKKEFEQVVIYCDTFIKLIPLSFVLGFYVSYVAGRWWNQYQAIPWPDKVMHLVALYVTGNDEYGRTMRRALMRYLNLSLILVLRSISSAVKRRFPTLEHVVDSGFMTSLELEMFKAVPSVEFNTYWIPCAWFVNLLKEARRSHRVPDAQGLKLIMEEFNDFRSKCGLLWSYDWVSIPLVYTQVVTLATYSFFAVALIGRQYIEGAEKQFQLKIDIYLPVFTILQFFFFMGLLKVAEQLINPFGDDDEDFELNWLIDRHTKVSYLGVDTLMTRCPPLVKDIYFDAENLTLPYTEAAAAYKKKTYRGSVADMAVPEEKQSMFLPGIMEEEEDLKEMPTPRTSTASLAQNDSPAPNRRQISRSPPTTPKLDRKCPETVLQLDVTDVSGESESIEARRSLSDVVKKLTPLTKSMPRIDQTRKSFFPLQMRSTSRMTLQPWPSATSLSRSAMHPDTPAVRPDESPWKVPSTSNLKALYTPSPTDDSVLVERFKDDERCAACGSEDCDTKDQDGSPDSDIVYPPTFSHANVQDDESQCSEAGPDSMEIPQEQSRPRLNSCPKYLVRRNRSTGGSRKGKGVHWKPALSSASFAARRKTAESLPPVKIILPQSKSSPNLRSFGGGRDSRRQSRDGSQNDGSQNDGSQNDGGQSDGKPSEKSEDTRM